MFETFVVQPIFNVLVLIYALLPGHNFGLAIILFTILVRLAMWPLVRKQLHQTKLMQKLQPELKEIKRKTKGDRQKEQLMAMELYKERGVNPLASIGVLIPQFVILIGLYSGLNKVVRDPQAIVNFAYSWLRDTGWMQQVAANINKFDETLFGIVDLTRAATSAEGLYIPALIIAALSSVAQYYQSKMLLPDAKDARKLRDILKAAGEGKQADQSEVQAATARSMIYILPAIIFFVTIGLPSAIGLYWLVGGLVAIGQQAVILREDEEEMEKIADQPSKKKTAKQRAAVAPEAEVVEAPVERATGSKNKSSGKKTVAKKKRKK